MLGNCGMKKGVVLGTSDSSNANTYRFSLEALIASLALKDKQANKTIHVQAHIGSPHRHAICTVLAVS